MAVTATFSDDMRSFGNATSQFVDQLSQIDIGSLLIGLAFFVGYLTVRSLAFRNVLRAAYPDEPVDTWKIWGAYMAAYGFNNVVPARGGDVIKLFLSKTSVPNSTYPAVAAAMFVESIFDVVMGTFILGFAFTQGVFPKPPDWVNIGTSDLRFFAEHPRVLLFAMTAFAVTGLALFAFYSHRLRRFWERVRQGLAVLRDRDLYLRSVFAVQFGAWLLRCTAFWFLLEAFHIGGSVKNVLLVLGVNAVAAAVPFTPGGAGVQQAFLVKVFAGSVATSTVAAYSVGQQVAIAVTSFTVGFVALVVVFDFRSFRDVIDAGRAHRAAEREDELH